MRSLYSEVISTLLSKVLLISQKFDHLMITIII